MLICTKNQRDLSVLSGLYWIKNKPSEFRSGLWNSVGLREEKSSSSPFPKAVVEEKYVFSLWSLERRAKGVITSGGKNNISLVSLNDGENCSGGLSNYFLLYNSIYNGFYLKG